MEKLPEDWILWPLEIMNTHMLLALLRKIRSWGCQFKASGCDCAGPPPYPYTAEEVKAELAKRPHIYRSKDRRKKK